VSVDNSILLAGLVGEVTVCAFLLYRRVWRILPLFCVYIAWSLVVDIAFMIILWELPSHYNRFYIVESIVDAILQFAVLVELVWSVLRPVRSSLPRGTMVLLIVLVGVAGLAIWPLAGLARPQNLTYLSGGLFQSQETFAILRVAFFLVMAGFSQILSIGWKNRELQVATGLGFYSIVSLLVTVLHSHQLWQDPSYSWLDRAVVVCYVGTMSYWAFSFATKEQQRKEFSPQMQQFLVYMGGGARASRIALSDLPSERPSKRI
jgi:hypothetical protein